MTIKITWFPLLTKNSLVLAALFCVANFPILSDASVLTPGFKWNSKKIRVCWANRFHLSQTAMTLPENAKVYPIDTVETVSSENKETIRQAIQEEFTVERVGITFSGWEDCGSDIQESELAIFGVRNDWAPTGRTKVISPIAPRPSNVSAAFIAFNLKEIEATHGKLSVREFLRVVALHEFGHGLGFREEFGREEWSTDPNCKLIRESLFSRDFQNGSMVYFDYDQNSVMSYCYLKALMWSSGTSFRTGTPEDIPRLWLNDPSIFKSVPSSSGGFEIEVHLGLSATDVKSLKCLYGNQICPIFGLDHSGKRIDQMLIRCNQTTKRREKKACEDNGYLNGQYQIPEWAK